MEQMAETAGKSLNDLTLTEMDELWNQSKKI
jgi:uncharacterized protein YabN with tetrapyrrole methylase and pyrophosphatase domain